MCDVIDQRGLEPLEDDEWVLDTPFVRSFVDGMRATIERSSSAAESCRLLGPRFRALLAGPDWLPRQFQEDAPESGMGGGIGQWLLFRAADRSLCLFSLVVPPGSMTPVHDHLAWGLVGLYRGNQDEEFYEPGNGELRLVRRRPAAAGGQLRAAAATQRRAPRPHHLRRDVRLDPSAGERRGLRAPPHVRRADRRGATVPIRLRERRLPGHNGSTVGNAPAQPRW